ncbi:inositol monophosphatase [candidate division KSB1 bacterium]|nr:inositol monophosphatase [candidate division KSB1 bacterium]
MINKLPEIRIVKKYVKAAGAIAFHTQKNFRFDNRNYKDDGSVLTQVDKNVENYLYKNLSLKYPHANYIMEESPVSFEVNKPYSFAIDPIDGTDVYSQGMPGWCVSVGLLDGNLVPVGGVIYAPAWGLLISVESSGQIRVNGRDLIPVKNLPPESPAANVMISSKIQKKVDVSGLNGKLRNIGSAALHMCFHLIYPGVVGTLGHGGYIWDIAAAHAVNRAAGTCVRYLNGSEPDYEKLCRGESVGGPYLTGSEAFFRYLSRVVKVLDTFP